MMYLHFFQGNDALSIKTNLMLLSEYQRHWYCVTFATMTPQSVDQLIHQILVLDMMLLQRLHAHAGKSMVRFEARRFCYVISSSVFQNRGIYRHQARLELRTIKDGTLVVLFHVHHTLKDNSISDPQCQHDMLDGVFPMIEQIFIGIIHPWLKSKITQFQDQTTRQSNYYFLGNSDQMLHISVRKTMCWVNKALLFTWTATEVYLDQRRPKRTQA